MSHTETHFGKLRKVELNSSIEEWAKQKCNEEGISEIPDYFDSWEETFKDRMSYKKYFFSKDEVWEAVEHVEEDDGDIDIMVQNQDGTVTFVFQFYNGGTCLSEMIEDGLARLNKSQ